VIFELWCTIIIGLLSLVLTILSSKGQLYDNRKKWYQRLSKRDVTVIIFGLLIVSLSAVQYWMIEKRNNEKDKLIVELQRDTPVLVIKVDGIVLERRSDTLEFNISIESKDAPCTLHRIDSKIELHYVDGSIGVNERYNLFVGPINIPKDQPLEGHQIVYGNKEIDFVYIGLVGDISTQDAKKDISVRDIYIYIQS